MTLAGDPSLGLIILAFAILGFVRGAFVYGIGAGALAFGAIIGLALGAPLSSVTGENAALSFSILGGAVFAAAFVGLRLKHIDQRLSMRWPRAYRSLPDRFGGAAIGTLAGAAVAWVMVIVLSATPAARDLHHILQRSAVAQTLLEHGPPVGASTRLLARSGLFPTLDGPLVTVDPPRTGIENTPAVTRAEASVVRVSGQSEACGRAIGSGWVAAPGVVVTNAHVVAGLDAESLVAGSIGVSLDYPAQLWAFDPVADAAALLVPDLPLAPLRRAAVVRQGDDAVVLGHTLRGRYKVAARYDFATGWIGTNVWGEPIPERLIDVFRAEVAPGNSGGPLVNLRGEVISTVYASTLDQPNEGGYGVRNEDVDRLLAQTRGRSGPIPVPPRCSAP